MATAVVVDVSPGFWSTEHLPVHLAETVDLAIMALRVVSLQWSWETQPQLALILALPTGAEYLYAGKFEEAKLRQSRHVLKERLAAMAQSGALGGESLVSQGLCMAACFVKKHSSIHRGRILLFDTSSSAGGLAKQSVEISNCGWALSQVPLVPCVDVVSLGGPKTAAVLVNLVKKTRGTLITPSLTRSPASVLQSLLFLSTTQSEGVLKSTQPKTTDASDMGAVCTCHANPLECGYICSVCLAVYCSEASGVCAVCGSRIRREIREELALSQKTFTQVQP